MATIAGVTVTFALPEIDSRIQNRTLGKAQDGTYKFYKFRISDRLITIPLRGITTSTKDSLLSALEGDADYLVAIVPDSHINLGNGAGTSINAQWIDDTFDFRKGTADFWEGTLNFVYVS